MDSRSGSGIELAEPRVGRLGPGVVVEPAPLRAVAHGRRRRKLELGERRAEVEARSADDERRAAVGEDLVDRGVRELRVLADRSLVPERPHPDEALWMRRAVREDRQAVVDLHRVGRDNFAS